MTGFLIYLLSIATTTTMTAAGHSMASPFGPQDNTKHVQDRMLSNPLVVSLVMPHQHALISTLLESNCSCLQEQIALILTRLPEARINVQRLVQAIHETNMKSTTKTVGALTGLSLLLPTIARANT
jgi:hypothetical protein